MKNYIVYIATTEDHIALFNIYPKMGGNKSTNFGLLGTEYCIRLPYYVRMDTNGFHKYSSPPKKKAIINLDEWQLIKDMEIK